MPTLHPRDVLLGAQAHAGMLPVCDHYCGVESRMKKSLQLQAQMMQELGACVFDVTLDCEDGAPAGAEIAQARLVADLANSVSKSAPKSVAKNADSVLVQRVGTRVHPVDHPAFASDVEIVLGTASQALSFVMLPKVETLADVERAVDAIDSVCAGKRSAPMPIHVLIESSAAVHHAFEIAAHARVESLSFGLMDFVSTHAGAIPAQAFGVRAADDSTSLDQFHHPLVLRAKLEIASACHAAGKVPSHCVVTELRDMQLLQRAANYAAKALGFMRMWSIHPDQIRPIVQAFTPSPSELAQAATIITQAAAQDWAPIAVNGKLHDRASYRYFWQVLERAQRTGCALPQAVRGYFSDSQH